MRELIRLVRAEFWKGKHTLLPALHLLIPISGILLFAGYYSFSAWSEESKVFAYIQVLSVAFPLIISIVCSMSTEREEEGHFQTFLGVQRHKSFALLAKWTALSLIGLGSVLLAVCGFAAVYGMIKGTTVFTWMQYVVLAGTVWLCSISLYLFHIFLGLLCSKVVSMCVGAAESLVAALFLTGLGEGIWPLFPCAYSGRWSGYLLLWWSGKGTAIEQGSVRVELGICIAVTVVIWGAVFLWFHYYEGRQCND